MKQRRLGKSGLCVPALSFGTATFGGGNVFFKAWGATDASGAARLIDLCLDHGVSLFDSARLDLASRVWPAYPAWQQSAFPMLNDGRR